MARKKSKSRRKPTNPGPYYDVELMDDNGTIWGIVISSQQGFEAVVVINDSLSYSRGYYKTFAGAARRVEREVTKWPAFLGEPMQAE